jgi:hypothetical protein
MLQESLGFRSVFETHHQIIGITDDDHIARSLFLAPRKNNFFHRLFLHTVFMAFLVYAIAIPFFLTEPTSLPLSVGIQHWVGIFHRCPNCANCGGLVCVSRAPVRRHPSGYCRRLSNHNLHTGQSPKVAQLTWIAPGFSQLLIKRIHRKLFLNIR